MDSSVSNIPALLSSIFNSNAKKFSQMELRAASKVTTFPQHSCKISEYVVKTSSMASKLVVDTRKGQTPSAVIGRSMMWDFESPRSITAGLPSPTKLENLLILISPLLAFANNMHPTFNYEILAAATHQLSFSPFFLATYPFTNHSWISLLVMSFVP
jgi:hypothetical protein